jgi:hypothetical protein
LSWFLAVPELVARVRGDRLLLYQAALKGLRAHRFAQVVAHAPCAGLLRGLTEKHLLAAHSLATRPARAGAGAVALQDGLRLLLAPRGAGQPECENEKRGFHPL